MGDKWQLSDQGLVIFQRKLNTVEVCVHSTICINWSILTIQILFWVFNVVNQGFYVQGQIDDTFTVLELYWLVDIELSSCDLFPVLIVERFEVVWSRPRMNVHFHCSLLPYFHFTQVHSY